MNTQQTIYSLLLSLPVFLFSCSDASSGRNTAGKKEEVAAPKIKEDAVTYTAGGTTFNGFVTYNDAQQGKRPVVLVVPEWWGLNEYPRMRARMLAEMGYLAMAVDMYGSGKIAADPQQAQTMAMPFYQNPQMAKTRLDAALNKVKEYPQADTAKTAAIGYCFGGSVVLNAAKLGSDLKGVVSFHGNLAGVPANKDLLKAKVLVCHGGADQFVSEAEVAAFKKSMDSINADYTFKVYPGATHAFTNPAATATGKKFKMPIEYNAAADTASWNEMKTFFNTLFNK
jgi:dienelactone hydrolase